jgi:hypothetical protein
MANRRENVVVRCRESHCENVLILRYDADLPKSWTCPVCEDALDRQMVDELERRASAKHVSEAL